MQLTGTNLSTQRNFYSQTGVFGFSLGCTVDNTTGLYHFGVSGAQGALDFTLQSGKMSYQNQFIHTYRANEKFLVRADFTSGHANVIRDGSPLIYGEPKNTGEFSTFYFNRENQGMGAIFDLEISGISFPQISVTNQGYLFSSGQNAVTGWFINQSLYPIRIFDNQNQASNLYSYGKVVGVISGSNSGMFAYSGSLTTFDLTQPILTTFNTNFGDTSVLFSIIDVRSLALAIQITGPTDFSFNNTGILNRTLTYTNYSGGFASNNYNTNLTFALNYVSGSGNFSGYSKTFTGSWDLLTGVDASSLYSAKLPGQYNTTSISGSGSFAPNSFMVFQVTHNILDANQDSSQLLISGQYVINPINQTLVN